MVNGVKEVQLDDLRIGEAVQCIGLTLVRLLARCLN